MSEVNAEFAYSVAGHEMPSPLVAGAGVITGGDAEQLVERFDTFMQSEVGAVIVGSTTLLRQGGARAEHGGSDRHYDAETQKMYNYVQMENIGVGPMTELAPELVKRADDVGKLVIFSMSAADGDAIAQSRELTERMFEAGAKLVEVNVSCRHYLDDEGNAKPIVAFNSEIMNEVVREVSLLSDIDHKVGFKLPPYLTDEEAAIFPDIAYILNNSRTGFISMPNSMETEVPVDEEDQPLLISPTGLCGLGGPAFAQIGRGQLGLAKERLHEGIDVISSLGLRSGVDMAIRIHELGAAGVAGTSIFLNSKDPVETAHLLMEEYREARPSVGNISKGE